VQPNDSTQKLAGHCAVRFLAAAAALADKDIVSVRAYVNDTCIIAMRPFFLPAAPPNDGETQQRQNSCRFSAGNRPLVGAVHHSRISFIG